MFTTWDVYKYKHLFGSYFQAMAIYGSLSKKQISRPLSASPEAEIKAQGPALEEPTSVH